MTKLMLRLVKDGKIVGYEWHGNGDIKHHKDFNSVRYCVSFKRDNKYYIAHDSFDLGIKIGDEWWFENDIIKNALGSGTIVYNHNWHCFGLSTPEGFKYYGAWSNSERIGSIYNEVSDESK